jgi:hypothetical protein
MLSTKHGAYAAAWRIEADVAERAAAIAELVPGMCPAFVPIVDAAAITSIRIDRAVAALSALDDLAGDKPLAAYLSEAAPRLDSLRVDLRRWLDLYSRLLVQLGLTPSAAASLGLDVIQIEAFRQRQLEALQAAGRAALDGREVEA